MAKSDFLTFACVQQVLDQGFQQCMEIAGRMYEQLESAYQGSVEKTSSDPEALRGSLQPSINDLYRAMTTTLFTALHVLQPKDFRKAKPVNFYFLPGYHSCLVRRRIFVRNETRDFGVGMSGSHPDDVVYYNDCCHASWYHYATRPEQERDILPASPYHWFGYQEPRISEKPHDLVASLTFSTLPSTREVKGFPEHRVLTLSSGPAASSVWGKQVARVLNRMPHRRFPEWKFPDRGDKGHFGQTPEKKLRRIRCLLISLWMHAVFEIEEPMWWDELYKEMEKRKLPKLRATIDAARKDEIANEWGDKSEHRSQFKTWTTIALHKLVAPPPDRVVGSKRDVHSGDGNSQVIYPQTIGWATFLSSVELQLPFISVARHWVRSVYGMLRTAEVAVLLRERDALQRATETVRTLPHDTHMLVLQSNSMMLPKIDSCDPISIRDRKYALNKLEAHTLLAHTLCVAPIDPFKANRARNDIREAIKQVGQDIVGIIHRVVQNIQAVDSNTSKVSCQDLLRPDFEIPRKTYAATLLLVGEMVRNYCRHSPDAETQLIVNHSQDQLEIMIEGTSKSPREGESFNLLHNMLSDVLNMGEAVASHLGEDRYQWKVHINLQ